MQRSNTLKENSSEQSHWCAVNPESSAGYAGCPASHRGRHTDLHTYPYGVLNCEYIWVSTVGFFCGGGAFWMCKLTVRIIINTNDYYCIHLTHSRLTRVCDTLECSSRYSVHRTYSRIILDTQILHTASCIHYRIRTRYFVVSVYYSVCTPYSPRRSNMYGTGWSSVQRWADLFDVDLASIRILSHANFKQGVSGSIESGHPTWVLQHTIDTIYKCRSNKVIPALLDSRLRPTHQYGSVCM